MGLLTPVIDRRLRALFTKILVWVVLLSGAGLGVANAQSGSSVVVQFFDDNYSSGAYARIEGSSGVVLSGAGEPVYIGTTSLKVTAGAWSQGGLGIGAAIGNDRPVLRIPIFKAVGSSGTFTIRHGSSWDSISLDSTNSNDWRIDGIASQNGTEDLVADTWQVLEVDLQGLGVTSLQAFTIMGDGDGDDLYYFDDVALMSGYDDGGSANQAPLSANDSATTPFETEVTIDVVSNDSDPDGDALAVDIRSQPSSGSISVSGTSIIYAPDSGFSGADSFTYRVRDPDGAVSSDATVSVTVQAELNQTPIAVSDTSTTAYETAVTIDVLANDSDPDGDALTIDVRSQPSSGTASVSGASIIYTPDAGFSGSDSFTYRVEDPDGAVSADATVNVTVAPESSSGGSIVAPVFVASSTAVDSTTISVPSGTQDGDLMVGVFTGYYTSSGSITLPVGWTAIGGLVTQSDDIHTQHAYKIAGPGEGAVTYGIGSGQYPVAGIVTYRGADGIGAFNFETGQGLTRANAGLTTTQDNSVLGLFSIGYYNSLNSAPSGMTQRASWDDGVSFIWTEELGVAGATGARNSTHNNLSTADPNDAFTTALIEILGGSDGSGGGGSNQTPIAVSDTSTTAYETAVTIDVLANDSDPDGDALTIDVRSQPSSGTASVSGASIIYTPDAGFSGSDSFTYRVEDPDGAVSADATVNVTVAPESSSGGSIVAPVFVASSTAVDSTTISVPSGTQDGDLMVGVFTGYYTSSGSITLPVGWTAIGGLVTQSDDIHTQHAYKIAGPGEGAVTYGIGSGQYPVAGIVTYRGADGIGAFNFETGQGLTRANAGLTTTQDNSVLGLFSIGYYNSLNSAPSGMTQRASWDDGVSFIWTEELGVAGATGARNSTHNNLSTADPNDAFTTALIEILGGSDGSGGGGSNQTPIAVSDTSTTAYETAVTIDVLANDSDPDGDALTIDVRSQPSSGTASVSGASIIYTPDAGFSGSDSFTYCINDQEGAVSADATVNVTVQAEGSLSLSGSVTYGYDDLGRLELANYSVGEVDYLAWCLDQNGNRLEVSSGIGAWSNAICPEPNSGSGGAAAPVVAVDLFLDGYLNGSVPEFGATSISTTTSSSDLVYDGATSIELFLGGGEFAGLSNDISIDSTNSILRFAIRRASGADGDMFIGHGSVGATIRLDDNNSRYWKIDGIVGFSGASALLDDVWHVVEVDLSGLGVSQFNKLVVRGSADGTDRYYLDKISLLSAYEVIEASGGRTNRPPVVRDDFASTSFNTSEEIDVLSNDVDPEGGALIVELGNQPTNGTIVLVDDQVEYTPNTSFFGNDSFTYSAKDPHGMVSADAVVTVTVAPPPNAHPVAGNDSATVVIGSSVTIDVLQNDSDPDGDPIAVVTIIGKNVIAGQTITDDVSNAALTLTESGEIIYGAANLSATKWEMQPVPGQPGEFEPVEVPLESDSFTYGISDGEDQVSATVFVSFIDSPQPNTAPSASNVGVSADYNETITIDLASHTSDGDGDPLTMSIAQQPSNGTVSLSGTNATYNPNDTFSGSDSFQYSVSDGSDSASATVTVTVGAAPQPPVAGNDAASTAYETAVTVNVLANDNDPEGGALSVQLRSQPSNGSATVSGTSIIYTPANGFSGSDSFTYRVQDPDGMVSSDATVTVTVAPEPNAAPVAANNAYTVAVGSSATLNVLSNDSDGDGDALTITKINGTSVSVNGSVTLSGTGGVVTLNGSGQLVYDASNVETTTWEMQPVPGHPGEFEPVEVPGPTSDSFTYEISDGQDTATATVTITLSQSSPPAPEGPVAGNDAASTAYETAVTVNVLANDNDPEGGALSVQLRSQPSNGSATVSGTSIIYTPANGFSGSDSFAYRVQDPDGMVSSDATVTVTVAPEPNAAPVAANNAYTVAVGSSATLNVLSNDSDGDGDALTITKINGTSVSVNGSVTLSGTGGVVTLNGSGQLVYDASNVETTTWEMQPVPGHPGEFEPVEVPGPTSDSFTYEISDGQDTATATVTITLSQSSPPAPEGPVAGNDAASTAYETAVTVNVLANDNDPEGGALSVQLRSQPSNGSATVSGTSIIYTPANGFSGSDSFTYRVQDPDGMVSSDATVTVTVAPEPNAAPVAANNAYTVAVGSSATLNVLSNDSDGDGDALTITKINGTSVSVNGSVTLSGTGGVVTLNGSGQLVYDASNVETTTWEMQPVPGHPGEFEPVEVPGPTSDSFTYEISDGQDTATATVTITLSQSSPPAPEGPVAGNDAASTAYETAVTVNVLANDNDPEGGALSVQLRSQPSNGSATVSGTSIIYTPANGFSGSDSFAYRVQDPDGMVSSDATVTVTVAPEPNAAPVAANNAYTVAVGSSATLNVLSNDSDGDGDALTITKINGTSVSVNGSVTLSGTGGVVTLNGSGQLVYDASNVETTTWEMQPVPGHPGEFEPVEVPGPTSDSFTYEISDGQDTATATVTITLSQSSPPAPEGPVAGNDAASTAYETAVTVNVLANDNDPEGGALSVQLRSQPSNGSATVSGTSIIYTPANGFSGSDSFAYRVQDPDGMVSSDATVTVTVAPEPNAAPVAANNAYTVAVGSSATLNVLSNDSDGDGDALTITKINGTSVSVNGSVTLSGTGGVVTLNGSGQLVYDASNVETTTWEMQPVPGHPGEFEPVEVPGPTSDSFTYEISDGQDTATATVTITLSQSSPPAPEGPVAGNDAASTAYETAVTVNVLANDNDPEGGALSVQLRSQPSNGSATVSGTSIIYTPANGFSGSDSFAYRVQDPDGMVSSDATVTVTVGAAPQPPVAGNDAASTAYETAVTVNVLANDNDPEGGALSVQLRSQPSNGSATVSGTSIIYTPANGFSGSDSFAYRVQDPDGLVSADATVTVTVGAQAPAWEWNPPANGLSTDFGTSVSLNLATLGTHLDPSRAVNLSATNLPAGLTVSSGVVTGAPGQVGNKLVTLRATEVVSGTVITATMSWDIEQLVDNPIGDLN